jgi:putative selenate reductase
MTVKKLFTGILSIREAAQMAVIYRGITTSLPFLFENSANYGIKESKKMS